MRISLPVVCLHLYLQEIALKALMKENLLMLRSMENPKENNTGLQLKKIQNETSQAEMLLEQKLEVGPTIRRAASTIQFNSGTFI